MADDHEIVCSHRCVALVKAGTAWLPSDAGLSSRRTPTFIPRNPLAAGGKGDHISQEGGGMHRCLCLVRGTFQTAVLLPILQPVEDCEECGMRGVRSLYSLAS